MFVNVLNRSKSQDIAAKIENQEGTLARDGEVWQMNYPDLKATHTFGDDQKVVPVTKAVAVAGNSFSYAFPAHSLTIVRSRRLTSWRNRISRIAGDRVRGRVDLVSDPPCDS